jgi:transcription elongation factor Elf1
MKAFSNKAEKVKVAFICDLCGVETTLNVEIKPTGETTAMAHCPVCYKEFEITINRGQGDNDSGVKVVDIADDDITITII